jgi:hypothetical protein
VSAVLAGAASAVDAIAGAMVTRFVVDDALTLELRRGDGFAASVRIDGALAYRGPRGGFEACVETGMPVIGPLFRHLFERILESRVEEGGALSLRFADATLAALPHPHAVAWRVVAADGRTAACLEDGRVVVGGAP